MNETTPNLPRPLAHGAVKSTITNADVHIRDIAFSADQSTAGATSADVSALYASTVHDNQRADGICTAADIADEIAKRCGFPVSEQFIYVLGKRLIDKNTYEGSSIKTMLEIARVYGAPRKTLVPTDDTTKSYADYINVADFSKEVYADALNQRIPGYAQTDTDFESIIQGINSTQSGVELMMEVGNNFYTNSAGQYDWLGSAISPLRAPNPVTGAHSIKCIKGDIGSAMGTLRNTWGDKNNLVAPGDPVWGNNGDIDFNYNVQKPYIVEAWVILPQPVSEVFIHNFGTPLAFGMESTEVACLQRVLVRLGFLTMPAGVAYGYYGNVTASAVLAFQLKNNVESAEALNALGGKNAGPLTLAALNKAQGLN